MENSTNGITFDPHTKTFNGAVKVIDANGFAQEAGFVSGRHRNGKWIATTGNGLVTNHFDSFDEAATWLVDRFAGMMAELADEDDKVAAATVASILGDNPNVTTHQVNQAAIKAFGA